MATPTVWTPGAVWNGRRRALWDGWPRRHLFNYQAKVLLLCTPSVLTILVISVARMTGTGTMRIPARLVARNAHALWNEGSRVSDGSAEHRFSISRYLSQARNGML